MNRLSTSDAGQDFSDALDRVVREGERIVVQRGGKDIAALVPVRDAQFLEDLEDRIDVAEAEKALAQMAADGEQPIPWEQVKARLGIE